MASPAPSRFNVLINLGVYFLVNLSLSTCNKLVLNSFPYPWTLTTMHATVTSLGCLILLWRGWFSATKLTTHENLVLVLFSSLFTINIAVSNISLAHVSLAFHQVVRSTGPIFTVLIYRLVYSKTYATPVYFSIMTMTIGIGLATYGDYYFTALGFCLTIVGIVLASIKTIATNRLMTGSLKLHPLEILVRMCPLAAFQSLFCAVLTGELSLSPGLFYRRTEWEKTGVHQLAGLLLLNCAIAFVQNVSSFHTNKVAGALTITVCANLKQCLTILLAIGMFHIQVGIFNGLGMAIALGGSALYSWIAFIEKRDQESSNAALPK